MEVIFRRSGRQPGPPSGRRRGRFQQHAACDLTVVERQSLVADDLFGFVSLSGDQDAISRTGMLNRPANGGGAIDMEKWLFRCAAKTGDDVVENRLWVFASRIVAGRDHEVGFGRSLPQQRPLRLVSIAAGAEDHDYSAMRQCFQKANAAPQRVVGMSVVDEDVEVLACVDSFETAGNSRKRFDSRRDVRQRDIELQGCGGRGRVRAFRTNRVPSVDSSRISAARSALFSSPNVTSERPSGIWSRSEAAPGSSRFRTTRPPFLQRFRMRALLAR